MSNVNIKRAVDNIRSGTSVYTPLVETIANAIQAIEAVDAETGEVKITVHRSEQEELDGALPNVESFAVTDNGIGFDKENRNSFDTLYSDHKIEQGGKGFGRFTCLKYFEDILFESVYDDGDSHRKRSFHMGKHTDLIVGETIEDAADFPTGSKVTLSKIKGRGFPDKQLKTIARSLVERLLPYFIDADYSCPVISIAEDNGLSPIILNNFVSNQLSALIKEMTLPKSEFELGQGDSRQEFLVRVFKIYSPRNQRSKVSLVADRREVTNNSIHNYVPEFVDEFFDESASESEGTDRNYIVKAYVFGSYLDQSVSLERGGFEFPKGEDLLHSISQSEIEQSASEIARDALGETIIARPKKKLNTFKIMLRLKPHGIVRFQKTSICHLCRTIPHLNK